MGARRGSCSSASSPATAKIWRDARSSDRPEQLLDEALEEAGIDRKVAYVTKAVKHFKWEPRGKKRIHQKPNALEIAACRPWLDAELAVLRPKVLVRLGATAAKALLGRTFRVTKSRGALIASPLAPYFIATVHPSLVLRAPDEAARRRERQMFVEDLRFAARYGGRLTPSPRARRPFPPRNC